MCIRCGESAARISSGGRLGNLCVVCLKANRAGRINKARETRLRYKKPACEHCGFVALHPCQLDVDHIDGNRDNDSPSNFRTLCANCHRLKTHLSGDYKWEAEDVRPSPQLRLVE